MHLGLGATAETEPEFTGDLTWYEDYSRRHASDGDEGRLLSEHHFSESWSTWEMHPRGHEVVICTAGAITLLQEIDGCIREVSLSTGEYAINPPGIWHTANVSGSATAVFLTAGAGTQQRPR